VTNDACWCYLMAINLCCHAKFGGDIVALDCPTLVLPPGVSIDECARRPVYGDVCVFRCVDDDSRQSASRRVRSCEVKNFDTVFWTGQFPRCHGLYSIVLHMSMGCRATRRSLLARTASRCHAGLYFTAVVSSFWFFFSFFLSSFLPLFFFDV